MQPLDGNVVYTFPFAYSSLISVRQLLDVDLRGLGDPASLNLLKEAMAAADRGVVDPFVKEKALARLDEAEAVGGFSGRAVFGALTLLAERSDLTERLRDRSSLPACAFERACEAWVAHVTQNTKLAERCRQLALSETERPRREVVHTMSIRSWLLALDTLSRGDLITARKYWRRALELGSTFGTASNLVVSWTYVAAFRP